MAVVVRTGTAGTMGTMGTTGRWDQRDAPVRDYEEARLLTIIMINVQEVRTYTCMYPHMCVYVANNHDYYTIGVSRARSN